MINFNRLLEASRKTQTSGKRGAGSPLLFLSDRGIGKTAKIRAFCEEINHLLVVIILGRIPSIDIGGVKVPNFETGELQTLISRRLLGEIPGAEEYAGVCVFFDEISASLEDQQTSIQSLIEDRDLEGHKVPDHVWFVCAGNPEDTNCGSHTIIRSLLDRLVVIEVEPMDIFDDWLEWAEGPGDVHPYVTAFLRWGKSGGDRNFFHDSDPQSAELAQPSARAWTKLSEYVSQDLFPEDLKLLGSGLVGKGTFSEFKGFLQMGASMATPEEIFRTPGTARIPEGPSGVSATFAVLSNLAGELRSRRGTRLSTEMVDAVITYLRREELPEAFAVFGFRRMEKAHPDFAQSSSAYAQFLKDHQDLVV